MLTIIFIGLAQCYEVGKMREIKFFVEPKETYFDIVETNYRQLLNKYNFFFMGMCHEINDIVKVVKRKKDWQTHRVSLYYNEDGLYFVVYAKNFINVYVLQDNYVNFKGQAHKLVRKFNKIKEEKEKEDGHQLFD